MARSGASDAATPPSWTLTSLLQRVKVKATKMRSVFLGPEQKRFAESQARAWAIIRRHHVAIGKAAERMIAINFSGEPQRQPPHDVGAASKEMKTEIVQPPRSPLSRLESLPEEIHMQIMRLLDHESLYRLSQTTGQFLRLSFDSAFEADAGWRAFRHTADCLGDGPRRRIVDGTGQAQGTAAEVKGADYSGLDSCPERWRRNEDAVGFDGEGSKPKSGLVRSDEDGDEGETMLEFMARQGRG
ncbi:Uu.00g004590.m01.CDS01 [Anthostomella pinea]|uniref:Uu.00g004590.m01.CDS01 n=1 Tax=Anthostomella pinea TaxID=933095 RepID=A0AAI8YGE6_9PEZI|nr:Uu.00g004590.m01.CDS01 [Anthostomella pinea]